MKAEIITVGDEILRGEILDSNKALLSERLLSLDVETRFHTSVCDDPKDIADALQRATERSDLVLVSGGLGPTRDDLTISVLAETFGRKLVLHEPSLAAIRAFFSRLGRDMAETNTKQAYFPEQAEVLPNPIGTAPGCMLEAGRTLFFCLPGVPRELSRMLDEQVMPRVAARRGPGSVMRSTLLRTFGVGESDLEARLRDVASEPGVSLGFRTQFPDNLLRPVARAESVQQAEAKLTQLCAAIRERLGALVYAEGERETLEIVTGRLLRDHGFTVASAESCTGGLLAGRITAVPGASQYFRGGVVAYSDAAKSALLGVPAALLQAHGAVSAPVARAMAEGARARFGADLALATTGIAGPGGGTPQKPVGLVCVALARQGETRAEELLLPLDRERHRQLTTQVALDWLRRTLLGVDLALPRLGRREP